jgi:hypothetical protein
MFAAQTLCANLQYRLNQSIKSLTNPFYDTHQVPNMVNEKMI